MTNIFFHKDDLAEGVKFQNSVAVDSETLGLRPERDPLCLVQLSSGDGTDIWFSLIEKTTMHLT